MSASTSATFVNVTDAAQTTVKFSFEFRLVASVVYDILLMFSLLINLLQLATYIKERKTLKTMAFFIISSQMLLFNLIVLIVMITFMTTVAFSDQPILPEDVYFVLAFAEGLSYNGLLLFAFLLTLNRIMVFAFPKHGRYFFIGWRIYFLIIVFWILAAVLVTGIMQSPCQIVAKPEDLGFGNECIEGEANIYNYIGQYIATYIPILMIVLYILLYIEIKIGIFCNSYCCSLSNLLPKSHKKKGHNVAEIKLLLQAAIICSTFFIQNFCWTYLPFITSKFEYGKELIFFAVMLSSILLYSVNGIVVLIFNGTVRRGALTFFKKNVLTITTTKAVTLYN